MTIKRSIQEITEEGNRQFRESEVKTFLPDLYLDVKDIDGTDKAKRTIAGIQDFLTPEDRLHNLVNSKRAVGLKSLQIAKAEKAPSPPTSSPLDPPKEKSFAESMFGLFNQFAKKTGKKSDEYKPKGPGNKPR